MDYYLRNLQEKDAHGMLEWMHDDNLNACFSFDAKNKNLQEVLSFIETANKITFHRHFAVCASNDEYLGTISLKNIDTQNQTAEYAVALRQKAIGTGAAKAATTLLLSYAFKELSLHKVYLNVLAENKRAIRFYEKIGFLYEGLFKQHLNVHGKRQDICWYAIFNEGETTSDEKS